MEQKALYFVQEVRTYNVLIMGSLTYVHKWITENCVIKDGHFVDLYDEIVEIRTVTDYEIY